LHIINGRKIDRITGLSALDIELYYYNKKYFKVYFLGVNEKNFVSNKAKDKKKYNNIEVQTYSSPFSDKFTASENRKILRNLVQIDYILE